MANGWVAAAGLGGFTGVALGAASTHLTGGDLHAGQIIDIASRYLLVHSLALLAIAALARDRARRLLTIAGVLFGIGMVVFAGGLTLLATTGWPLAALATPIGGTTLLLGWLCLAGAGLTFQR